MTQNNEFGEKVFQQFMKLFISPAISERQNKGELPDPLELKAAQIIFYPDGRKPEVRINREVKAIGKVKLKNDVSKVAGEKIYEDEVEGLKGIALPEKEYPDCGHATLIRFGNSWTIAFDFRYNKNLARKHFNAAMQFLNTAEHALKNEHWSPFIDNLYSAAELAARSILLLMADKRFREKGTHKSISLKYNNFANLGNVEPQHIGVFNKLYGIRDKARYLKKEIHIGNTEAEKLIADVKGMLDSAKIRIGGG